MRRPAGDGFGFVGGNASQIEDQALECTLAGIGERRFERCKARVERRMQRIELVGASGRRGLGRRILSQVCTRLCNSGATEWSAIACVFAPTTDVLLAFSVIADSDLSAHTVRVAPSAT